jgi:carbonic anhydrase/acetyltransferase-like protein (isoleucine patch superfamily)
LIGDEVSIGPGATVLGPSKIGAYGDAAKDTGVGPNAVIDGATVDAGAIVGGLARVGPGVTIPPGMYVIPGSNVTTEAEATNPALGMVEAIPAAVLTALKTNITRYPALAAGYTNLYQGNSNTGANPGTSLTTVFNGNLTQVEGASPEPGNATSTVLTGIAFESTTTPPTEPSFVGPFKPSVMANLFNFKARIIGGVTFGARPEVVANYIGNDDSIRGDQGQPIAFTTNPYLANNVTITSPGGGITTTTTTSTTYGVSKTTTTTTSTGSMKFGKNFAAGDHSVILGGTAASYTIGNNVTIGPGAVVSNTQIGTGVTVGARAYVSGSTLADGTSIPAGEVLINNKVVGNVQF